MSRRAFTYVTLSLRGITETPCCDILLGRHSAHLPGLDDGDDEEDDGRSTKRNRTFEGWIDRQSIQGGSGGWQSHPLIASTN